MGVCCSLPHFCFSFAAKLDKPAPECKDDHTFLKAIHEDIANVLENPLREGVDVNYPEMFARFVSDYVAKMFSDAHINERLKRAKGTTLIEVMTASDMALCALLLTNFEETWPDEYRKSKMEKSEQDKFKKKNQVGMDDEDKAVYTITAPKWTLREGTKREFGQVAMDGKGLEYYREMEAIFDRMMKNEGGIWEKLEDAWASFSDSHGIHKEWRVLKKRALPVVEDPVPEIPPMERLQTGISLPGDAGFQDPFAWKRQRVEESEEDSV